MGPMVQEGLGLEGHELPGLELEGFVTLLMAFTSPTPFLFCLLESSPVIHIRILSIKFFIRVINLTCVNF